MSPINIEQCEPAKMNVKYAAIIAGLLLLIIAVLGQLWLVERNRRADAENQLGEMILKERVMEAAGAVAATDAAGQKTAALDRASLPTATVKWNGQDKTVLLLDDQTARTIGLEAGDAVMVTGDLSPATSRP